MKIVSLLPGATELLCAMGLQDNLVAVSHECDYPAAVATLPRVTSSVIELGLSESQIDIAVSQSLQNGEPLYSVNSEMVQTLQPDLIVTQGLCDVCAVTEDAVKATLLQLPSGDESVAVLSLSASSFEGLLRDIEALGEATGARESASRLALGLQARWNAVRALPPAPRRPRVMMLEWPDPAFSAGHWVPEMVQLAGGEDVFGLPGARSERLTWTQVKAADPDLMVSIACGYGLKKNRELAAGLRLNPELRGLRALERGRLWAADANSFFSRPSPRIVRGAELLAALFERPGAPAIEAGALESV